MPKGSDAVMQPEELRIYRDTALHSSTKALEVLTNKVSRSYSEVHLTPRTIPILYSPQCYKEWRRGYLIEREELLVGVGRGGTFCIMSNGFVPLSTMDSLSWRYHFFRHCTSFRVPISSAMYSQSIPSNCIHVGPLLASPESLRACSPRPSSEPARLLVQQMS